ncbi:MAG: glutamate formimidoyltransferase [Ardenticatenaceae bacterium]|nr:glutamate formimidoyltransferase [Ardenticatenaceae bacterium]
MPAFVECVPNFSEGRRPEVVEQIAAAMRAVPGLAVLNVQMDPDHNRSVITTVGSPDAVGEAAFRATRVAAGLINLDEHRGEHPRMGATDVIPFVPVREVTMAECVELARQVGRRIGEELGIPVYLYEAAATRPERRDLAAVRRGEYEAIKAEIATVPERAPDFGPRQVGPAGAVAVGARPYLIAFNVYLGTANLDIAKEIARAVRHSSGGLRYVKALGLAVEEGVQVSMNLTDFTRTPIHRVVEMIRSEARRHGVPITRSEIVGLVPQQALLEAAIWYLQLDDFESNQVLENRLADLEEAEGAANHLGAGGGPC